MLAHRLERALEAARAWSSVACVSCGSGRGEHPASSSALCARSALPSAVAWSGRCAPTSRICSVLSGRKTWWMTSTPSSCRLPTRTASPVRMREVVGPGERAAAQLVDVEVDVPELEQRRAELVLAALGVLLDEALLLQRLQQAMDGALGEAEALGQLRDAEPARAAAERRRIAAARSMDWIATLLRLSSLPNAVRQCRIAAMSRRP